MAFVEELTQSVVNGDTLPTHEEMNRNNYLRATSEWTKINTDMCWPKMLIYLLIILKINRAWPALTKYWGKSQLITILTGSSEPILALSFSDNRIIFSIVITIDLLILFYISKEFTYTPNFWFEEFLVIFISLRPDISTLLFRHHFNMTE